MMALIVVGCGSVDEGNSQESSSTSHVTDNTSGSVSSGCSAATYVVANGSLTISGQVTYDRIGVAANDVGLDHENISKMPARQVVVKAIGPCGEVVTSTTTNEEGEYLLTQLPSNQEVKIRVYAQMQKSGTGGWNLQVQDNTNDDSIYVMEGSLISTGTRNSRRSLHAPLGWNSALGAYTSTRMAAPFAILDSLYDAMKKVITADPTASFPRLLVNWSVNNIAAGNGSEVGLADGQIITSHFDGDEKLYILGDANSDTDEFDDHIIIHEWAHYFEANFSRADSIGGAHGEGDRLDIRVAFGEGWGNAYSAIATDNPIYYDTLGQAQSQGWSMNIESARKVVPGWFSEASVQRIIYDLYDAHDDGQDHLSLGFAPIYHVLTGPQKITPAFTSLFSFITALKNEGADAAAIDDILGSEDIGSIDTIYGNDFYPLYADMSPNESFDICTSTKYGYGNKLDNHKYIRFRIDESGLYTVRVRQNNGNTSDPDYMLFKTTPFTQAGISDDTDAGKAEEELMLSAGDYLLDLSDYKNLQKACFTVTVNK